MDELDNLDFELEKKGKKQGVLGRIKDAFQREAESRRGDKYALLCDLTLFAVGFVFSRCHLLFGARPLGLALASVLPFGVWSALGGIVIGSLTLGERGIIFAAISTVAVLLRAMLSDKEKGEEMFSERLLARMAVAVICGFVGAVYEWFVGGLTELTLLFGLSMILLPPTLVFVFSGAFSSGITLKALLSPSDIFSAAGRSETERYNALFFRVSSLAFLFFISLSLGEVVILGISAAYVFCGFSTLLIAKRFGTLHALTAGFVSALGISGVYSVSFALLGLGAGALFSFGIGYGIIAGGAAMSAWSAYYAGLTGFLTTFPEYLIATTLALTVLKKISSSEKCSEAATPSSGAEDMVGTMALAYRNKYSGRLDLLENALFSAAAAVRSYIPQESACEEDYRLMILDVAERFCADCSGQNLCTAESIRPCITNAESIAKKLSLGEKITSKDVNTDTEFCAIAGIVAASINREAARMRQESFKKEDAELGAELYELVSKLISEAIYRDTMETAVDENVTEMLTKVVEKEGIEDGIIRAFGERRKHLILACEDGDGSKISSKQLRENIESSLGIKLSAPEFFRRGKMALMECDARRGYFVTVATASRAGSETEVSGDSAACFESRDDYFYSLISDGMGKGSVAKETSEFVTDYMRSALEFMADKETVIRLVNSIIRSRGAECSATVDLFELDLITGESTFLKSGAASSYVKRESSIFRIRSRTAPIGLLKTIDTEKIKVDIKAGDYVIMLSDGIVDSFEDAPWLLELLSRDALSDVSEYARLILSEATKNATLGDDMSVTVIKINAA